MLSRDDEHMDRRFWIDVTKGHAVIRLVHQLRRNFSPNNFAEQTLGRHRYSLSR